MNVLMLTVCFSIPLSNPAAATFDFYPVIGIQTNLPGNMYGMALPYVALLEDIEDEDLIAHELQHHRQARALTWPGFLFAYLVTLGRPFEDYLGASDHMWTPPERNACE